MNMFRFFNKNNRKGFTLTETLVTVAIVAVLCAIAIPSIITVNRSIQFRDLNNNARAVYLSAQSTLAQMRSSGDLAELAAMTELDGAHSVPENNNADMGSDWNEQLRYTVTGTDAFELVLPANTLDAQIRNQQILIEYNPVTGYVYAVFYSEGEQALSYSGLSREEDERKDLKLGYYCGGTVTIAPAEVNSTAVSLSADTDGQELIASVIVPVPESYTNHQDVFRENLSAKITIHGEMSGTEMVIPTDSLSLEKNLCIGSPNYIEFTFVLDSLNTSKTFAKLNDALQAEGKSARFTLGENLTLTADVQFTAPEGYTILTYDNVLLTGVNSLFSRMEETTDDSGNVVSYAIEISNGRHLQNLNALDSSIAAKVKTIALVDDIYWNETVEYYEGDYDHFAPITKAFRTDTVFSGTKTDGNYRILYLNIDETGEGKTGDAGLFSLCNLAEVKDLALVSPTVKGTQNVGALAGAANGTKFTNCSVYIDTEDEYFSWDAMEEYGVVGSGAGGLVGYAYNGSFTNCFAAVNVDAAENAGGFVGYSDGADASMCYASGNITGEVAGGFVGYSDSAKFSNCFASGDVTGTSIAGGFTGKMECTATSGTYNQCYAVGVVKTTEENGDADGFCGTSNLDETVKENEQPNYDRYKSTANSQGVYTSTYYLSRETTTEKSYYADPASYDQLSSAGENNVPAGENWEAATDATTHRYTVTGEGVYPFVMLKGMDFYGDWEDETFPVAIAYYETYADDEDSTTEEIGYYINSEKTATLRNKNMTIESDGYVLLVNVPNATVTVEGYNGNTIKARETDSNSKTTYEQYNGFYIYDLPATVTRNNSSFYNKVTVKVTAVSTEDESQTEITTEYILYYNPDFALTQLNPTIDEAGKRSYSAKRPSTTGNIPSKIYIRTARHLAAIAENTTYQGSGYNYIQMVNVDFGTYKWGTENNASPMKPIETFAGTYTGKGGYVDQAKIVMKSGVSLFGTVSGKVADILLSYEGVYPANNWLATTVSGTLDNCDVKWDRKDTAAAAAVAAEESTDGEAAETAETVEAAETEETPLTGGMIGTVAETGKVTGCDLITAGISDVDAGFVGLNEGEISYSTVAPEGTSGKTTGLTIGFAAENRGTIRSSMANTDATNAAFVGTNSGTIADCYAWYPGTTVTETETTTAEDGSTTETVVNTETEIVFAENDEGEILTSYAAIYAKSEEGYSYALLYNESGIAAFVDTLEGAVLSDNWRTGSSYPYAVPKGIAHRGGYDRFKAYPAFTGYYYYEAYGDGTLGVYIETLGIAATSTTEAVEGKIYNELKDETPAETGYGIFNMTPVVEASIFEVANVALTLDSAPIVPSELDPEDYEAQLQILFATEFDSDELKHKFTFKELSSESVYVLNGTEISTWFAPMTEDGEYRIRTGAQFAGIEHFSGEKFVQELDVTVETPIAKFSGVYDGDENNITYTGTESALFGEVTGTVKNVVLKDSKLSVTLDAANGKEVQKDDKTILCDSVTVGVLADVAGKNATIQNCRVVEPEITVTETAKDGMSVEITAVIGGLVGENHGKIKVCSVEGLTVTHTAASLTEEQKKSTSYTADITVGGLVGYMTGGWMSESFATGEITTEADDGDIIGGAIGEEDQNVETEETYVDCYAAVNVTAPNATVGSFIGSAYNGEFWACHGWNGVNPFAGKANAEAVSLSYCYYYNEADNTVYQQTVAENNENALSINAVKVEDCSNVSELVDLLNGSSDPAVWSDSTWDPEAENTVIYDVIYPVLKDRYDADARTNQAVTFVTAEEESETVAAEPEATEQSDVTAEPEATGQPDVTAEPETTEQPDVTAEPETTETPAETAEPEVTPEPTAEPAPETTETPEPTAETESLSEAA